MVQVRARRAPFPLPPTENWITANSAARRPRLPHALLGEDLVERLDGAVGEGDEGAVAVGIGPFYEPRLRGPAAGSAVPGVEHCRCVMNGGFVQMPGAASRRAEHCSDGRALPCFWGNAVWLQSSDPKLRPRSTGLRRWPLGPDVGMVVEIGSQAYVQGAKVAHASSLGCGGHPASVVGDHDGRKQHDDGYHREQFHNREGVLTPTGCGGLLTHCHQLAGPFGAARKSFF